MRVSFLLFFFSDVHHGAKIGTALRAETITMTYPTPTGTAILRHDENYLLVDDEVDLKHIDLAKAIWLLLSGSRKFADLLDEKVEGSRPDDKIKSPRSPRSAPVDKG
jgi:hypothetical protein